MSSHVDQTGSYADDTPAENALASGSFNFRRSSVRGGVAKLFSQIFNFVVRILFIAILSRFIVPEEFGIYTMALVFISFFEIIATGGFSQAAVQNEDIDDAKLAYLFLCNLIFACSIALICVFLSRYVSLFYSDERIGMVIIALIPGFLFNSISAVPTSILQRQMRFVQIAFIDVLSSLLSAILGIVMAVLGYGYWSLVAAAVALPTINSAGAWVLSGWFPRFSGRATGIFPMVKMGLTVVLNNAVIYLAYNAEKILLGRFWGAQFLGLYARASQLNTLPGNLLNQAIGPIAFAALSRLQSDQRRLKIYYLNFYYLMNAVTIPLSFFVFLFSSEIIATVLGANWSGASLPLQFLAPSIMILGMMNPTVWLLFALGYQKRSLVIAIVIAPLCIAAYFLGLPYGPQGVAIAYTCTMALWLVPHLLWCFHGTPVTFKDALSAVAPSFLAAIVSASAAFVATRYLAPSTLPVIRLGIAVITMGSTQALVFLVFLGQGKKLFTLLDDLRGRAI